MIAVDELQKIKSECQDWIVELSDDDATPAEQAKVYSEFQEWIKADTLHAECFEETQRLWGAIGQMHHLEEIVTKTDRLTLTDKIQEWFWTKPLGWGIGAATSFVLVTLVMVSGIDFFSQKNFSTEIAEIRDVMLPDESLVTLGAKSEMEIDFTNEKRQVFLKNGNAFFAVQKDPERPFFVAVDGINVRVVGTKFGVHHGPVQVRVSVQEGKVTVTTPKTDEHDLKAEGTGAVILTLGQQLITDKQGDLLEIKQVAARDIAKWRNGWLSYDGANLREVVADANRYYYKEIILESEVIETLKVTASFKSNNIEQLLTTLVDALPIVADRSDEGRVILRPAPEYEENA